MTINKKSALWSLFGHRSGKPEHLKKRSLNLEQLEERQMLSITPWEYASQMRDVYEYGDLYEHDDLHEDDLHEDVDHWSLEDEAAAEAERLKLTAEALRSRLQGYGFSSMVQPIVYGPMTREQHLVMSFGVGINRVQSSSPLYNNGEYANVYMVDTLNDVIDPNDGYTSLREAIISTNTFAGYDLITFAEGLTGTIYLNGTALPTITEGVNIQGPGADVLTIDAGGMSRIFVVIIPDSSDPIPAIPTGLSAVSSQIGDNVTLSWNASAHATDYAIYRRLPGGLWSYLDETNETTYTDETVRPETTYEYRLIAANYTTGQMSSPSSSVNVTTYPGWVNPENDDWTIDVVTVAPDGKEIHSGETAAPVVFRFTRSGGTDLSQPLLLYYNLSGTATYGSDYTISVGAYNTFYDFGYMLIPANQSYVDLSLNIIDDDVSEITESVIMTLLDRSPVTQNPQADYYLGTHATAQATVIDNDDLIVKIEAVQPNASETFAGETSNPGQFKISRLGGENYDQPLTVYYTITGNASLGSDYTISPNNYHSTLRRYYVTIPANEACAYIDVNVIDDYSYESTESVILTLYDQSDYIIDPIASAATVNITDNDVKWNVSIEAVDADVSETLESETPNPGRFKVSRADGTNIDQPLTVSLSVGGTAAYGTDYTTDPARANSGQRNITVTIPANETSAYIDVNVIDDLLYETDKTVILAIQTSSDYNVDLTSQSSAVIIRDNDVKWNVSIEAVDTDASETLESETPNPGRFKVTREGGTGLDQPLTVMLQLSGTAVYNSDYTTTPERSGSSSYVYITIPADETFAYIDVNVIDDLVYETDETVILTIRASSDYNVDLASQSSAVIIRDNDVKWNVSIEAVDTDASETLESETPNPGRFKISREGGTGLDQPLTVMLQLSGTAVYNSDYTTSPERSGSSNYVYITIPANETSAYIDVNVIDDLVYETDETVILAIRTSSDYNVDLTSQSSTVIIRDNDVKWNVSIETIDADASETLENETPNPGRFKISREDGTGLDQPLTVTLRLSGTAAYHSDYTTSPERSGSSNYVYVTIPANQTFAYVDVNAIDDLVYETDGTVILTIQTSSDYNVALASQSSTIIIRDNDVKWNVSIETVDADASETLENETPNPGRFKVTREGGTGLDQPLTVMLQLSGTAAYNSDYTTSPERSGSSSYIDIVIPANQTFVYIDVNVIDDLLDETDETVILTIQASSNYDVDLASQSSTVIIRDNDLISNNTGWNVSVEAVDTDASETFESETPNPGRFKISREGGTNIDQSLTVYFTLSGSASLIYDYTISPNNFDSRLYAYYVTIPANETCAYIDVNIIDDFSYESTESVILTLYSQSNYNLDLTSQSSTVIIRDNDVKWSVSVEAVDADVSETFESETPNPGRFKISRAGGTDIDQPLTVQFTFSGSASLSYDYTISPNNYYSGSYRVTIPAGQTFAYIDVDAIDDFVYETDESVILTIQTSSSYNVDLTSQSSTVIIRDNDVKWNVSVEAVDTDVSETFESETPNPGRFKISRAGGTNIDQPLTVQFTLSGSASLSYDYTISPNNYYSGSYRVTIPAGQTFAYIDVDAIDDFVYETDESVILTIQTSSSYNVDLASQSSTVIIRDNDVKWSVSVEAVDADVSETFESETSNTGRFKISRADGTNVDQTLTVYFTLSGSASIGSDYTISPNNYYSSSYRVTIPANQTFAYIDVDAIDDLLYETDESVILTIQTSSSYDVDLASQSSTVIIRDNDVKWSVSVEAVDADASETFTGDAPNPGRFKISRADGTNIDQTLTVYFTLSGSASIGSDYTISPNNYYSSSYRVTIPANQTFAYIDVDTIDDLFYETDESVILTIQTSSSYNVDLASQSSTVIIRDNDVKWSVSVEAVDADASETFTGDAPNPGRFKISRADGTNIDQPLTVSLSVGGTATYETDYTTDPTRANSGQRNITVTIPANQTFAYVDVNVIDDSSSENLETVILSLLSSSNYIINENAAGAIVTIADNDIVPNVWIESQQNGAEGDSNGQFVIKRDNTQNALTLNYTLTGTATNGSDYTRINSIVFPQGIDMIEIPVSVTDDALVEGNETVVLTLTPYQNNGVDQYTLENTPQRPSSATITIADNDIAPNVWIESWQNGAEGGQNGQFVIKRDNTQNALTLNYTLTGTATNGSDYTQISSIVFPQGIDTIEIPVSVTDDALVEGNETVVLTLNQRRLYLNGVYVDQYILENTPQRPSSATITIADNDIAPNVWIESRQNGAEGGQNGQFVIKRDNTQNALTLNYTFTGTASSGSDYTRISSIVFPQGIDTIEIPVSVIDDALVEGNETLVLTLNQSRLYANGVYVDQYILENTTQRPSSATITIADNDIAPNVWIESWQNGAEGGQNGQFVIKRDNTQNALTLNYTFTGTASSGSDYTRINSVVFPQGVDSIELLIEINDDNQLEENETVMLTITSSWITVNGNNIYQYNLPDTPEKPSSATITITENEIPAHIQVHSIQDCVEGIQEGYVRLERDVFDYPLTLDVVLSGTAVNGVDYRYISKVTFPAGEQYADISIYGREDKIKENTECVMISVLSDGLCSIDFDEAILYIHDRSYYGVISVKTMTDQYGNDYFRISRDKTTNEMEIEYSISGDATPGIDIELLRGMDASNTRIGILNFAVGQEYIDIPVIALNYDPLNPKSVILTLVEGRYDFEDEYFATIDIKPFAVHAKAVNDRYYCDSGSILVIDRFSEGLLSNDYDEVTENLFLPNQVHVELVSGPEFGILDLNPDGTFQYQSQSDVGVDVFTYRVVTGDGRESNICTVIIETVYDDSDVLEPISSNLIPEFPIEFGLISIGWMDFNLDPKSEFVPTLIGTYQVSDSDTRSYIYNMIEDDDSGDPISPGQPEDFSWTFEETTFEINSIAFDNGDWIYYETVTWSYNTFSPEGDIEYWGGFTYTFISWDKNGRTGFSYLLDSVSSYDFFTSTESHLTNVDDYAMLTHEWGYTHDYRSVNSWFTENRALETQVTDSRKNSIGRGTYSYEHEGIFVEGNIYEQKFSHEISSLELSDDLINNEWTQSGYYFNDIYKQEMSDYAGFGEYFHEEEVVEDDSSVTDYVYAAIEESGSTRTNQSFQHIGVLGVDGWSMEGSGSTQSQESMFFSNIYESYYHSEVEDSNGLTCHIIEQNRAIFDDYSKESEIAWGWEDDIWIELTGYESEFGYCQESGDTEIIWTSYDESGNLENKVREYSEFDSMGDSFVEYSVEDGEWELSDSRLLSEDYGYSEKDILIDPVEYTWQKDQNEISGSLGIMVRDEEEVFYSSESSLIGGEWQLQTGNGFWRNVSSMGDYAFSEGEYTESGTGWSYSGKVTDEWINLQGTGSRIDYLVENEEWAIDREWQTEVTTFQYNTNDQVKNGTKQDNVVIAQGGSLSPSVGNYRMNSSYGISDKIEVAVQNGTDESSLTWGTRAIKEYDAFYETFSGVLDWSTKEQLSLTTGTKVIDNYFERNMFYEWEFMQDDESLHYEKYHSLITENQSLYSSKLVESNTNSNNTSAKEVIDSYIDNERESDIIYTFDAISGNQSTKDVVRTEHLKVKNSSGYNKSGSGNNYSAASKQNSSWSDFNIAEELLTISEEFTSSTGTATSGTDNQWIVGTLTENENWNTEETKANGSYWNNGKTLITEPEPDHSGWTGNCITTVKWSTATHSSEGYDYSQIEDSRYPEISDATNHVWGSASETDYRINYNCDGFWIKNSNVSLDVSYDETIGTNGFYSSGNSYKRPTGESFSTLDDTHDIFTPEEAAVHAGTLYISWIDLNFPESSIQVGSQSFADYDDYFSRFGYVALNHLAIETLITRLSSIDADVIFGGLELIDSYENEIVGTEIYSDGARLTTRHVVYNYIDTIDPNIDSFPNDLHSNSETYVEKLRQWVMEEYDPLSQFNSRIGSQIWNLIKEHGTEQDILRFCDLTMMGWKFKPAKQIYNVSIDHVGKTIYYDTTSDFWGSARASLDIARDLLNVIWRDELDTITVLNEKNFSNNVSFTYAGAVTLFTTLTQAGAERAAGEGHHFFPQSVTNKLFRSGMITREVADVFMSNSVNNPNMVHCFETWDGVSHGKYNRGVETMFREFLESLAENVNPAGRLKGSEITWLNQNKQLTVKGAEEFVKWLESGSEIGKKAPSFLGRYLTGIVSADNLKNVQTWTKGYYKASAIAMEAIDSKLARNAKDAWKIAQVAVSGRKTYNSSIYTKEIIKIGQEFSSGVLKISVKAGLKSLTFLSAFIIANAAANGYANEGVQGAVVEGMRELTCAEIFEGLFCPVLNQMQAKYDGWTNEKIKDIRSDLLALYKELGITIEDLNDD